MSVIMLNPLQCGDEVPTGIWGAAELASWKAGPCDGEEPQQTSGACQSVCLPPASAFYSQGLVPTYSLTVMCGTGLHRWRRCATLHLPLVQQGRNICAAGPGRWRQAVRCAAVRTMTIAPYPRPALHQASSSLYCCTSSW